MNRPKIHSAARAVSRNESHDLQELSQRAACDFIFVVLPLCMAGATGSPVNPIALIASENG